LSKILRGDALADCQAWLVPEVRKEGARGNKPFTARQLEDIQKQAQQEGFQQGLQEGRDVGLKEFQERFQVLEEILQSLGEPFRQLDESVEQQLAELAMLVARQLVRRELKTEPEQVISVVREALAVLPVAARNVRLALHPEDAALIREALSVGDDNQHIQLIEDPVQSRGGCKVLTDTSQIDASVESRLNAIIANVLGGLRSTDAAE
jgi:flagellar assembly protein FliH